MKSKNGRSVPFEPILLDKLKDVDFAAEFLSSSFDGNSDEDFEAFFDALQQIIKAQGVTNVAEKMASGRDVLYKMFQNHNPTVRTLRSVLNCLELDLAVVALKRA